MTEATAKTQTAAILDRLAPDPTTPYTAMDAAHRLLFFGIEATIQALIEGIESDNRDVAILSLDALESIVSQRRFGETPLNALPAVISALARQDRLVRGAAISAIEAFGEPASAATPALLKIAQSDEEYLRIVAAGAVLKVSQDCEDEMRAILEGATDSANPMCAHVARESLGLEGG